MNTEMIAMDILESLNLKYKENEYTLRFTQQRNDNTRYAYFIQNKATGKEAKYNFTEEVSQDFVHYNNESLFEYLPKQIQLDLENGII